MYDILKYVLKAQQHHKSDPVLFTWRWSEHTDRNAELRHQFFSETPQPKRDFMSTCLTVNLTIDCISTMYSVGECLDCGNILYILKHSNESVPRTCEICRVLNDKKKPSLYKLLIAIYLKPPPKSIQNI